MDHVCNNLFLTASNRALDGLISYGKIFCGVEHDRCEQRYFIASGTGLAQHIPCNLILTYCGITKEEIITVSPKLMALVDDLDIGI